MARHQHTLRKACTHAGCKEFKIYHFDTLRELRESDAARGDYLCIRHGYPNEVLGAGNMATEVVMTNMPHEGLPQMFWNGRSGFVYGPGFKAFANDFPAGARLIVTARIELPEAEGATNG